MAARVYHQGKLVRDIGPHEALPEDGDPGDFFWLDLFAPTPEELSNILAFPTAIAGIYGMNFDYMPEFRWTFGHPLIVAGMTAVCLALYWRFKCIGWLR